MTRPFWIAAILLAFAPLSYGSDSVRITEIGVKGYYLQDRLTRVGIILLHRSAESIAVDLRISAHSFPAPHVERIDTFEQHLQLGPMSGASSVFPCSCKLPKAQASKSTNWTAAGRF